MLKVENMKKLESILCVRREDAEELIQRWNWDAQRERIRDMRESPDASNFMRDFLLYFSPDCLGELNLPAFLLPRDVAEIDESFLQIIPYLTVVTDKGRVLTYRRSKASGEDRLHDKWSIGIGGHVNVSDIYVDMDSPFQHCVILKDQAFHPMMLDIREMVVNAVYREFCEELMITRIPSYVDMFSPPLCVIENKTNSVDRVHLGVSFLVLVYDSMADRLLSLGLGEEDESELDSPEFRPINSNVWLNSLDLEEWSKCVLNLLRDSADPENTPFVVEGLINACLKANEIINAPDPDDDDYYDPDEDDEDEYEEDGDEDDDEG